jgi:hypothetical protein
MSERASSARVELALHGIGLVLESENAEFARYTAAAMEPFVAPQPSPRVRARLAWVDGAPGDDPGKAFGLQQWERRPDRDVYVAGPSVYWLRIDDFEDLQLRATWQAGVLELEGRYHFRLGRGSRSDRARKLLYRGRLDVLRARRFSTLLYYLVYHPILWLLGREQGWCVLHAGAVASGGSAVVLAGMPGCGKSTLAVAMTADPAWTMLSDNLVLCDGRRVLACPEMLLLDRRSLERVGTAARRLAASGEKRVYERDAYRPDTTELRPSVPSVLFNVGRGLRTELVPLDAAAAVATLRRNNLLAKEVRRIAMMGEILDLVAGTSAPDEHAALAALAKSVPCHQLWVGEGADLANVIRETMAPAFAGTNRVDVDPQRARV